jgi:3-methyladenine DNA glycosylase AlkC
MMKSRYSADEIRSTQAIVTSLKQGDITQGIRNLEKLKDEVYTAIPDKQRRSRGITWVLQRICSMMIEVCSDKVEVKDIAFILHENLGKTDKLQGVPIFLMAEYGINNPIAALDFFEEVAKAEEWEIREFAAGGFQKILKPNKEIVLPWIKMMAASDNPNARRFVSEMLRPVSTGQWLRQEPGYSLGVLGFLFREAHPYPRTSVGNNLSDLSKYHPELILSIVKELVLSQDKNSYWIAHRACRNLVKEYPERVLDVLGVNEYHYKDRHYYRDE